MIIILIIVISSSPVFVLFYEGLAPARLEINIHIWHSRLRIKPPSLRDGRVQVFLCGPVRRAAALDCGFSVHV